MNVLRYVNQSDKRNPIGIEAVCLTPDGSKPSIEIYGELATLFLLFIAQRTNTPEETLGGASVGGCGDTKPLIPN